MGRGAVREGKHRRMLEGAHKEGTSTYRGRWKGREREEEKEERRVETRVSVDVKARGWKLRRGGHVRR